MELLTLQFMIFWNFKMNARSLPFEVVVTVRLTLNLSCEMLVVGEKMILSSSSLLIFAKELS
jgi:hypothetical protein